MCQKIKMFELKIIVGILHMVNNPLVFFSMELNNERKSIFGKKDKRKQKQSSNFFFSYCIAYWDLLLTFIQFIFLSP